MTRRTGLIVAAMALAGWSGVLARQAQEPQATFRAAADLVTLDVSVRQNGRPFAGLAAADFQVLDNGVQQDVADLSYERLPIDVTVALDVSSSVTGAVLDQLRRAVRQLRTDLNARDRLKLVTFNMRVNQLMDFSTPSNETEAVFDKIAGSGSSAIFDTLAVTLTTPVAADRRQLIVLFTDGLDSGSITDPLGLLEVARRTTPTVAIVLAAPQAQAISLSRPQATPRELGFRQVFTRLASETGGALVPMQIDDNLTSTFHRVLDEFRSSYVLHFAPRGVEQRGAHTLTVRVTRPGRFDVRARSGYIWR